MTLGVILYIILYTILLYIILLYIYIYYTIISYIILFYILFLSHLLRYSPNPPLFFSFPPNPLIYLPHLIHSFPHSVLSFQILNLSSSSHSFLPFSFPYNLSSHSFYTCRHLLLDTYISSSDPLPLSIFHRDSDPACFIGVDG